MPKTNAERQADFQRRKQQRLAECVTPADVLRAIRLNYESEGKLAIGEDRAPFDEWTAKQRKARGGGYWTEMVPHSGDPDDYDDSLSAEDRAFLARVGAVAKAVRFPPHG